MVVLFMVAVVAIVMMTVMQRQHHSDGNFLMFIPPAVAFSTASRRTIRNPNKIKSNSSNSYNNRSTLLDATSGDNDDDDDDLATNTKPSARKATTPNKTKQSSRKKKKKKSTQKYLQIDIVDVPEEVEDDDNDDDNPAAPKSESSSLKKKKQANRKMKKITAPQNNLPIVDVQDEDDDDDNNTVNQATTKSKSSSLRKKTQPNRKKKNSTTPQNNLPIVDVQYEGDDDDNNTINPASTKSKLSAKKVSTTKKKQSNGSVKLKKKSARGNLPKKRRFVEIEGEDEDDGDDDGDGDDDNNNANNNNSMKNNINVPQHILLQQLEDNFDYEGRLPSKQRQNANDASSSSRVFRCGYVSILGAPNMGKSTLLNAMLEEDLCIVTSRPQTTRHAILGVMTTQHSQVCLIDTPGIIDQPAYRLQENMMESVRGAFVDSDVLLVVTDLYSTPIPDDDIFDRISKSTKPTIVAINKIDLDGRARPMKNKGDDDDDDSVNEFYNVKTFTVPEAVAKWRALLPNALAIIPLSALEGPNNPGVFFLRQLLVGGDDIPASIRAMGRPIPGMFPSDNALFLKDDDVKTLLPPGPPLYDEDSLTDRSERFFVSEIIRETLFECLKKELPYCCEVQVTDFKESISQQRQQEDNDRNTANNTNAKKSTKTMSKAKRRFMQTKTLIKATIFVERDSQKLIVVGAGGEQIKSVGMLAREKIERFLGGGDGASSEVFLELIVKVNKDWRKKEDQLRQFGYLKPK